MKQKKALIATGVAGIVGAIGVIGGVFAYKKVKEAHEQQSFPIVKLEGLELYQALLNQVCLLADEVARLEQVHNTRECVVTEGSDTTLPEIKCELGIETLDIIESVITGDSIAIELTEAVAKLKGEVADVQLDIATTTVGKMHDFYETKTILSELRIQVAAVEVELRRILMADVDPVEADDAQVEFEGASE